MSSMLLNTKSEFLKTKKTAAYWLTIFGAAFIPMVNMIKYLAKPGYFVPIMKKDIWNVYLSDNWQIAAGFLLTIYIVLVTSLVVQIEFRNNTWKQVYALPRTYSDIYFSKFFILMIMIASCFILFNFSMAGCAVLTGLLNSDYAFDITTIPVQQMAITSARMFLSVCAMTVIQYVISLQFKNFVVPIGIGLGLMITGFMIRQWEHADYFPYLYPLLAFFQNASESDDFVKHLLMNSLVYAFVGLVVGRVLLHFKKEKG